MEWNEFPGHRVELETSRTVLRPFRESDFLVALPFYTDPAFRDAIDSNPDVINLEYLRSAGLYMAERGWFFAIELKSSVRPIGEVCFQRMNLDRARVAPSERVFRLPIGIWDKSLWGRGIGGEVLDRLIDFGFGEQRADRICAMDVALSNHRSRRLFESRGFRVVREVSPNIVDLELSGASRDGGRVAGDISLLLS
jgi:RimJ/RimL family protein N-acetyltransferase